MIKKLFGIFIPLCIFSFIAFGVSAAVLGTGYGSPTTDYATGYAEAELREGAGSASSWELNGSYTDIKLDAGAYNIFIGSGEEGDDTTYFSLTRSAENDRGRVEAEVNGDTLEITVNGSVSFGFGYLDRLFEAIRTGKGFDEIFKTGSLSVIVPPRIYESLETNIGSGSLEITNINARSNTLYLGSGKLCYYNDGDFTADSANVEVNSGYIQAHGIRTREYYIDMNSGKCEISGLSGEGSIDVNSGNGTVVFDRLDGNCEVYVNSGTLDVFVPDDISARLTADINSGGVYVSAADSDVTKMRDGDVMTLGGGEHEMGLTLNSGRINVMSGGAESAVEITVGVTELEQQTDFGFVDADGIASAVEERVESAVKIAEENIAHFVEAPEVPSTPTAPRAPAPFL